MPRIGNRYGFRRFVGKKLEAEHILTINPQSMSQDEPVRVNVTESFGGAFGDDYGISPSKMIVIAGHTGQKAKESFVSGFDEFQSLREEIFRLRDKAGTKIVFDNYTDNEHWEVVMLNFQMRKEANRSVLYQYAIQMKTLAQYSETTFGAAGALLDKTSAKIKDFTRKTRQITGKIRGYMNTIQSKINVFDTATRGLVRSTIDLTSAVVDTIELAKNVTEFIETFPKDSLKQANSQWKEVHKALGNLTVTIKHFAPFDVNFDTEKIDLSEPINMEKKRVQININQTKQELAKLDAFEQEQESQITQENKTTVVNANDTIQSIAQRTTGDRENWQDLLKLNGIKITQFNNGVLTGRTIIIPAEEVSYGTPDVAAKILSKSKVIINEKTPITDEQLFKMMFLTEMGNQFTVTSGGDILVVEGIQNLRQQLANKLKIKDGDYESTPESATIISDLVGNDQTIENVQKIQQEVKRVLLNDPRVLEVEKVTVRTDGEVVNVEADVIVRTDSKFQFTFQLK